MEPVTDINGFLNEAKTAITEYQDLCSRTKDIKASKEKCEKTLIAEKEALQRSIEDAIAKRREEIDDTYDQEIKKHNEELRRANLRRDKARNQGVKDRIAEETAELKGDIRQLQNQIKTTFRQKGVPGFCNSKLYYALFLPHSFSDFLILILAFAICFVGIPFGVWKLFYDGNTTALVIIYVIDVLVFGGLYMLIMRTTMVKHHTVLEDMRQLRIMIRKKKTQVAEITRSIQNDADDKKYDLAVYDDEIAHIKQQLADTTVQKKDALNTFETVTKNIISDERTANAKPRLDELTQALNDASAQLTNLENERSKKALELSDKYETYLGKELMSPEKIDSLLSIAQHGTATNLSEVIEEYNKKLDENL